MCYSPRRLAPKQIKQLLVDSRTEFVEVSRALAQKGQTDTAAVARGASQAAAICVASEEAFPEAVSLVK